MAKKTRADLLIENADEIVTLGGGSRKPLTGNKMQELGLIRDGCIVVKDGKILAVGKACEVKRIFAAEETISAEGKTVVPGFVDPHTHLVFAGSREDEFELRLQGASYMEILRRGGGILKTVCETRKASEETLIENCKKTLNVMLEHGTTTVEAKSGYGLALKDEIKCLKVMQRLNKTYPVDIVPTFLGAHAVPSEYEGQTDAYVDVVVNEMISSVAEQRLAEFCDVFCEKDVFDIGQSRRVLLEGKKQGLALRVHADEMTAFGGAELASEVGAVSAEHLLYASAEGLGMMVKRGVIAVLLSAAAFALMMSRYADARGMISLGLPVALGTDFNPSCWVESQQLVMALACRQMRMTPAEALIGVTINAAHAVNRAHEVGSLELGKKADIVILNVPNHRFLGYRFGVNLVDKVVKEGRIVFDAEQSVKPVRERGSETD